MQRVRVSSSDLKDVGYDPVRQVLEVGFLSGGVYEYSNVPESKYLALMSAVSKGAYLEG